MGCVLIDSIMTMDYHRCIAVDFHFRKSLIFFVEQRASFYVQFRGYSSENSHCRPFIGVNTHDEVLYQWG